MLSLTITFVLAQPLQAPKKCPEVCPELRKSERI